MQDIYLGVYKKNPKAELPTIQTRGSACFDLAACLEGSEVIRGYNNLNEPISYNMKWPDSLPINPGFRLLIPTGLVFDIPTGYSVRVHNRSSLPLKKGLMLANNEGVIDSDYVEEIFVILYNASDVVVMINHGDRIAQAELVKDIPQYISEIVKSPGQKTDRVGGLGSTGENSNAVTSIAQRITQVATSY